jgi:hypothetical protein
VRVGTKWPGSEGDRKRAAEKLDAALEIYRQHGAGQRWIDRVNADRPSTPESLEKGGDGPSANKTSQDSPSLDPAEETAGPVAAAESSNRSLGFNPCISISYTLL